MANRHTTLVSLFDDVADAIRSKNNTSAEIVADNFDTNISALNTGIDATAAAGDIMSGKTAVVNNAVVTGTLGTATVTSGAGTASATTTVAPGTVSVANKSASVSGKTQVTVAPTTATSGISKYYAAVNATAAANSTGTTSSITGTVAAPSVGTAGYISSSAGTKNANTVSGTATAKTSAKTSDTYYMPLTTGVLSASDSSVSGGSFTPALSYNSTNANYDYSGSKAATGTAYAKATTAGYVTSAENTSKSLSATVSATGTVAKAAIKSTNSGTTTVTPVISKNAISISGVTDAASGSATTTAPSSGVYVAVQSAENTGTLTSTPSFTSATAQYTDGTNHSTTPASSTVGANASAVTYVPIKSGSATTPKTTITTNPTISWDSTNNKIKATYNNSQSVTPTVSAGWVASGTAGEISTTGTTSIDPESLDSDLKASNIRDGVTIFDIEGNFSDSSTVSSGQSAAAAGNILTGKSAFLDGDELKGSMTNNGAVTNTITSQGGTYTIPAGYHNGSGKVTASITASTLDNTIISGEAIEETTGDYGWKTTVAVPAGYHNNQTLTKTFSEIFPAPETPATADKMLSGYQAYNKSGVLMTGTMANNGATGSTISTQGGTYTIPAGYTSGGTVTASINNGVITSGAGSATISDPVYNSTDGDFDLTASGTVAAPTVGTAGYVSSSAGTKNTNTVSGSKTLAKVGTGATISGTTTKAPTLARTAKPSADTWVDAASGAATTTKPTSGPYVQIDAAANTGTLTATPKVTSAGYGTTSQYGATAATATVGAAKATTAYVPITTTSASVLGKTVSYGTGWITSGSKSVADGGVTLSDTSLSVSPSVTPTATASATNGSGLTLTADSSTGVYFKVTGGNSATTGSATSGESCTVTKTAGYISAGTSTVASTATATANANSTNKYYRVTAVTVPKDIPFTVSTTADTALDTSSNLTVTNNAYRQVALTNNANGDVNISGAGRTDFTVGSTTTGTLYATGYIDGETSTSSGSKAVISNGKWTYNNITPSTSAQGPYYGETRVKAATTGAVKTPATTKQQSAPTFSLDTSTGVVTASVAATSVSVTPSVTTNGWVTSSQMTAGTITMSANSNTYTLPIYTDLS